MNKPHKHAEVIKAWADGREIELLNENGTWLRVTRPSAPQFSTDRAYRIHDPLREYKEAYARGEMVEVYISSIAAWVPFDRYQENSCPSAKWEFIAEYPLPVRIAPKPDYTLDCDTRIAPKPDYTLDCDTRVCGDEVELRVTFDGTTDKPKSVELVK